MQGLEGSEGGLVGTLAMRQSGPEAYCVTRSTCSLCLKAFHLHRVEVGIVVLPGLREPEGGVGGLPGGPGMRLCAAYGAAGPRTARGWHWQLGQLAAAGED